MSKRIALVAHDARKPAMIEWATAHRDILVLHRLWGTGTTGSKVQEATGLEVNCLLSGPLGGDQQLGAMIAEGRIDVLIFFIDALSALPHDVDVKALIRVSTLYQTVTAFNETTASHILHSPLLAA
ncbi:MAG TPA: methylglyoxal synthase [Thiolinea sp.]|nr:methylglyoxal synthase [Thiolinea sp.]